MWRHGFKQHQETTNNEIREWMHFDSIPQNQGERIGRKDLGNAMNAKAGEQESGNSFQCIFSHSM